MADTTNQEKNSSLQMFTLGQDGRTLSINENLTFSKVNRLLRGENTKKSMWYL